MAEKMKAFHLSRQGTPGAPGAGTTTSPQAPRVAAAGPLGGSPGPNPSSAFAPPHLVRPTSVPTQSAPAVPRAGQKLGGGLAAKRGMKGGMNLADAVKGPPIPTAAGVTAPSDGKEEEKSGQTDTAFSKYSEFVDTKKGTLKFKNKATLHGSGIEFPDGRSISISLDEVETIGELGKGNYGTVYQVRHRRPQFRRQGMGLAGNKDPQSSTSPIDNKPDVSSLSKDGATGLVMAMKEIRLELDEAKFAAIIMELDVLHRCVSPFIVDFYGAFFQEGAVYICMEFMDGGSIDKLYGDGIPESVLRKITLATTMGLKSLKDDHNIIHRDVKPTNILANTQGQVKICDFGVSGNLVASIAKTNIGCQSYMAPERIAGGGVVQAGANPGGGTYSVQSDVWSLGLSVVECAMGRYPYPPETYNNIFSQLSVGLIPPLSFPAAVTHHPSRLSSKATLQACPLQASRPLPTTSSPPVCTRCPKAAPRTPCSYGTRGSHHSCSRRPSRRMLRLKPPLRRYPLPPRTLRLCSSSRARQMTRSAGGCAMRSSSGGLASCIALRSRLYMRRRWMRCRARLAALLGKALGTLH